MQTSRLVLALDQGTTSSRAVLFDHFGSIRGVAQQEFPQHYPRPAWVEQDPYDLWNSQLDVARRAMQVGRIAAQDLAAIGITNQRETTILWDRQSGEPVYPAIVWQDRRTDDFCQELIDAGHQEKVQTTTGLLIDPYFCATKIRWMLDHVPGLLERARRGEIAFGTVDSWLLWHLTGGKVHATDVSNASRTMLMNLSTGEWDADLLELLKIPAEILPEIRPSCSVFGETLPVLFGSAIPVGGIAGDQQSALFGQNCLSAGMAKNTYGTGCFLLMNTGEELSLSKNRLLTTRSCVPNGKPGYALEGSIFVAGAVVQWLRDGLGIIQSADEVESLACSVPDHDGVYVVPAFAGLGAPHWNANARGTIVGMTRGTTKAHIARAALEGIAFQVADVVDAMTADSGVELSELRVDGGAAANDLLMQFQADLLQVPVVRPKIIETTSLGAAFLAGLAVGYWSGCNQLEAIWQIDATFHPQLSPMIAVGRRHEWTAALECAMKWSP